MTEAENKIPDENPFSGVFSDRYGRFLQPRPFSVELSDLLALQKVVEKIGEPSDSSSIDFFTLARRLSKDLQNKLFETFFAFAGYNNPLDLASFFTTLNNMPWLKPKEEVDMNILQQSLDDYARRAGLKPKQALIVHHGGDFMFVQSGNLALPRVVKLAPLGPGDSSKDLGLPGFNNLDDLRSRPGLVVPRINQLLENCLGDSLYEAFRQSEISATYSDFLFGFFGSIKNYAFYHAIFIENQALLAGSAKETDPYGPLFRGVYEQGLVFFPPTPRTENRPVILLPKKTARGF